ncbi:ATP-binding protein [Candidatus Halobeggiatoa sp. HSG11]|nr:ATP-binding protein [Candidatus Halobeggiatoa sp. HSG11]
MQKITLSIDNNICNISLLNQCLQVLLQQTPLSQLNQQTMLLAAMEAVNNSLQHAYALDTSLNSSISMQVHFYPERLELHLYDNGMAFDVNLLDNQDIEPDPLAENGRGLFIIQQSLDKLTYWREQDVNHWCLLKYY